MHENCKICKLFVFWLRLAAKSFDRNRGHGSFGSARANSLAIS